MLTAVDTVKVDELAPVMEVGLNIAVAPVGKPLTLKTTAELKLHRAVVVAVQAVALPCTTVCDAGAAAIVKSGVPFTTRVTVVPWTRLPFVPAIVSVYVPGAVVAAVDTVSVDDPLALIDVGLNVPVAPVGKPLTLRAMAELKPPDTVVVAVYVVPFACTTVCEAGEAVIAKSGGITTTSVTFDVWTRLPLMPVIVSG